MLMIDVPREHEASELVDTSLELGDASDARPLIRNGRLEIEQTMSSRLELGRLGGVHELWRQLARTCQGRTVSSSMRVFIRALSSTQARF